MGKLNPVEQAKLLEKEYRNYVKSTFTLDDENFNTKFSEELDNVQLVKGPYLNKMLPFQTGKSINELCASGVLNNDFKKLGGLNLERPLYKHQVESLEKISRGRSVVVTTGTGSGKTESYLFPILNHIMNDPEIDKPGVRAIFLFPMNALVNDQMKRIRELLSTYPKIKFGRYVGDTKDHIDPRAERNRLGKAYNCVILQNELVTREEIRENPPHLLFTNYSMLEYLLLRPKDRDILSPEKAFKWQFIVLDEAHTYNGALGIEVSMLLRRLIQKIQRLPQFLLTSATLGDQGKSEQEIVQFANSLTAADYTVDDIIFSSRKQLESKELYRIEGSDYSLIRLELDNEEKVISVLKKYANVEGLSKDEAMLKVFKDDINVSELNQLLRSPALFKDAFNHFDGLMTEQNLSDLIYLVSYIFTNTRELFDVKYHTFIRTVDGCFVTLNKDRKLSLQRCLEIEDFKTFEIGKCKKCSNVYVIGKIESGFLRQNTDLDIYENVEEGATIPVDYFIINDDISEYDQEYLQHYILCTKCGKIYDGDETHPSECKCGEEYLKDIYRVKKDDSSDKSNSNILYNNNITYCPCCRKSSNSGIVSSFYLGKDSTTAVLTQIMMKAIDNVDDVIVKKSFNPFDLSVEPVKPSKHAKQLLEFSDGRQQASFAATFCSYNHERFLRKKLLFDVCKDENDAIPFATVKSRLENRIRDYDLFDNVYAKDELAGADKNAWITILNELLNIDGSNGAEGLGLYAFQPNFTPIKSYESYLYSFFESKGISLSLSADDLYKLLSIIVNFFRNIPAIEYNSSNLTYEEKKEEFSYRMFDNSVMLKKDVGSHVYDVKGNDITNRVRSLLPAHDSQSNRLVDYVMAITHYDMVQAKLFVSICFELLRNTKLIIPDDNTTTDDPSNAFTYKAPASNFVLIGPKVAKWCQCSKCRNITMYNINNICPQCSNATLVECDPNDVFVDNYYRKEYMNKKVERLVYREHTGQLQAEEASKIQQEFQDKKINVLSCSTTFEMGVDIGTLETVFMRNVPPTPANYVQRAGRAGRGKDSSAFVLTFCGTSSHDYTYFCEPEKMISGKIVPPLFKISNKKIVLRHIVDTALSFHLKYHENDFVNVGTFMNDYNLFKNYIISKSDSDLNIFINYFIEDAHIPEYRNWGWIDDAFGTEGIVSNFAENYTAYIDEMDRLANEAYVRGDSKLGSYYTNEKTRRQEERLIDALASEGVIPKYGFPVDTVKLAIPNEYAKVDLTRDLQIALSEYAPESEVIAEGVKYTSRYIILPKTGDITKYYYFECQACHKINYNINPDVLNACTSCGLPNSRKDKFFIVPNKGFKSDLKSKVSKTVKPKKSYSNDIQYIGNGICEAEINFKDKVELISNKNDELLVLNENPFYMCNTCGYTVIDKQEDLKHSPSLQKEHSTGYEKCECKELQRINLGYAFRTDVVKLKFAGHYSLSQVTSFMYALLDGISEAFTIERNDINGVISQEADATFSVVLYDDVSGGAGHVKRLLNAVKFEDALKISSKKIKNCSCDIRTSCYNCLRNYRNQRYHKLLVRLNAIAIFDDLLK